MDNYLHCGRIGEYAYSLYGKDVTDVSAPLETITHPDNDPEFIKLYEWHKNKAKVAAAREYLNNTDYVACKIAEGSATREEYAVVIAKRQEARAIINEYENDEISNETIVEEQENDEINGDE